MPRYIDVNPERLSNLHEALELIESVDADAFRNIDLHVYGLTSDPQIVDSAKEAIAEDAEVAEEDVQLSEVAVAIPLSSDIIYYLAGSGLKLQREDFAYTGAGGEGVRTMSFAFAHFKPRVTLARFSKLALASSSAWLDDFLKQQGSGKPAQVTPNVRRTEEATQPGVPPASTPGRTSALKLGDLIDKFLD
jgi:hypothetical protein